MSDDLVKGFFMKTPHENAPDFVKRKVGVNVEQFVQYLHENANEKGYVNFDLLEAKSGHWYLKKDEYQPREQNEQSQQAGNSTGFTPPPPYNSGGTFSDDIPF
jgi:hypothetical protein